MTKVRYTVTYITNKIVDAQDLDLTLDEKLRVICPSCNFPLAYISTINNSQFFRHPKRLQDQMSQPQFQCEQRVGSHSLETIRSYNKIIDQTNLRAFQSHFYKILLLASGVGNDQMDEAIAYYQKISRNTASAKAMQVIEKECKAYGKRLIKEFPDQHREALRRKNARGIKDMFERHLEIAKIVDHLPKPQES